jgi:lipopolysaccharide biosynthesis regulator YciM
MDLNEKLESILKKIQEQKVLNAIKQAEEELAKEIEIGERINRKREREPDTSISDFYSMMSESKKREKKEFEDRKAKQLIEDRKEALKDKYRDNVRPYYRNLEKFKEFIRAEKAEDLFPNLFQ